MTDTRVMVIDASKGLIGGHCVVWNRWCYGTTRDIGSKFRFLKSGAYQWAKGDIRLLADHDTGRDCGEVFGKSIIETGAGLWAFATLRDPVLWLKATIGGLYFSPAVIHGTGAAFKGGSITGGVITEVSLTDNPGLPPSPRHAAENEATNARIDAIREALDTLPPDADEETVLTALEQFLGPQSNEAWAELRRAGAA